jgi:hypothetical protein
MNAQKANKQNKMLQRRREEEKHSAASEQMTHNLSNDIDN